ncbi:hypothetical protein TcWFU_000347 [Taenia crassiceps]|uniref:Secreted protein n=1 Tax=Taenia crassiceps TaxID=6207 RepID=A0ABR4QA37_9CEST
MSTHAGEAIVPCSVALVNTLAFVTDGWLCGKVHSQSCLETSIVVLVVPPYDMLLESHHYRSVRRDGLSNRYYKIMV